MKTWHYEILVVGAILCVITFLFANNWQLPTVTTRRLAGQTSVQAQETPFWWSMTY